MFPEVDSLPGAQSHPALVDGDGEIDGREGSPHMGGHVVVALDGMHEQAISIGHQPCEEVLQVAAHVRVSVFLNQEGGGSVAEVQGHQAGSELVLCHPGCDFAGEFIKAAATRGKCYLMQSLA